MQQPRTLEAGHALLASSALNKCMFPLGSRRFALTSLSQPGHVWFLMGNRAPRLSTCQLPSTRRRRLRTVGSLRQRGEAAVPGHVPAAGGMLSPVAQSSPQR